MAYYGGWENRLFVGKESTFGTAVTPAIWIPYESFEPRAHFEAYSPQSFCGVRQDRGPTQVAKQVIAGTFTFDLFGTFVSSKSIMEWLLELATSGDASITQDSFTFGLFETVNSKDFAGVRIASVTISGSEGQPIKVSMSIIAKSEATQGSPVAIPATTAHPPAGMFYDTTFAVGGSAVTPQSFTLTIDNGLKSVYLNSATPTLIDQFQRKVTLDLVMLKSASTYDLLRRTQTSAPISSVTGQVVLKAHNLDTSGTPGNIYTTATIDFDKMDFQDAANSDPRDSHKTETLKFVVKKPNTTDNDIDITYATTT